MKQYYEAYDLRYRQVHARGLRWFDDRPTPIVAQVMERYSIDPQAEMLEIGCGEGRDAAALLAKGCRLLATDVSPHAVEDCRRRFPQWQEHFRRLDCLRDVLENRFDFIYAMAVLHMLVPDEDRAGFWRFIAKHLAKDGLGLVMVMGDGEITRATDIAQAFESRLRVHEKTGTQVEIASTSCRMVSMEALRAEIAAAGLEEVETGRTACEDFPMAMYAVVRRGDTV